VSSPSTLVRFRFNRGAGCVVPSAAGCSGLDSSAAAAAFLFFEPAAVGAVCTVAFVVGGCVGGFEFADACLAAERVTLDDMSFWS
jgi:hypothetical protein